MNEYDGAWITTFTGRRFHFLNPQPDEICIEDIAHALSNICRFNGHVSKFYSVAQHSWLVADILPAELKLAGLLHDASEAYIADLSRPVKHQFPDYKEMEDKIMKVVGEKYGFNPDSYLVKFADNVLIATEARDLMDNTECWDELPDPLCNKVIPFTPEAAEKAFMQLANLLLGRKVYA